jgi:hypothetical protein
VSEAADGFLCAAATGCWRVPQIKRKSDCVCEKKKHLRTRTLFAAPGLGQRSTVQAAKGETHRLDLLSVPLSSQKCDYECSFEPLITKILKPYKKRFEIFLRTRREALISAGT